MTTTRKNIMLGTAGHVDHGKTALVKLLTGCNTDTLAVEQQRGLTIELGFAPCRMRDERIVGIVDVPGHVGFIRNMVAGAQGVDVVILVVAADDGVMPQTREHLDILTLMGVRGGLIALTKVDMVDDEMRELATEDVRDFVAGTFLADAPICPISNITGEGFDGFFGALDDAVDACRPPDLTGLFRLWVERVFNMHGFGMVVSGIPGAGDIRPGDRLRLMPGGQPGRVRKLQVYGEDAELGRAGECVAINLAEIDTEQIGRGQLLTADPTIEPAGMVEADLHLLAKMPKPLDDYAEVHLHVGTAEVMANVAMLEGKPLPPGERQLVQLRMRKPLPLTPGERFVIRGSLAGAAGGQVTTLGGGRILDTSNRRLRRNRPWTLAALSARRDALDSPPAWCALTLAEAGEAITPTDLAQRAKMPAEQIGTMLPALRDKGVAVSVDDSRLVHRDVLATMKAKIAAALETFHAANPMRLGMQPADVAAETAGDGRVLSFAIERMLADNALQRHGDLLALTGCEAQVPPEDVKLCLRIESALRDAALEPPLIADLAGTLGEPAGRVDAMLDLLADQGTVVRLDRKVVMHAEGIAQAKTVLLEMFRKARGFPTMEFRDALGVSRKYAIPLLDYFDTQRLTVRSGSRRTAGVEARKALGT